MVKPGAIAADIGLGLAAGLAGTAAMTVSSAAESKLRGRSGSSVPVRAASKVLGVEPQDERNERRFGILVHWGYGTGWGAARGLLAAMGLPAPAATAAHLAALWGSEQVMLPALGVISPAEMWSPREIAISAWHDLVYAGVAGAAYELLDNSR